MVSKAKKAPGQKKSTRSLIIDKSIALFAKKGVTEVTFQEIALECKLSQPATFYYFKNKEQLILAIMQEIANRNYSVVQKQLNVDDDAYVMLLKHFLGNLIWCFRYRGDACVLLHLYALASSQKKYAEIYSSLLARARERMLERVMAGVREKIFTFTDPKEEIAERLHDVMLGAYVNLMTSSSSMGPVETKKALTRELTKWNATLRDSLHYQGKAKEAKTLLKELGIA